MVTEIVEIVEIVVETIEVLPSSNHTVFDHSTNPHPHNHNQGLHGHGHSHSHPSEAVPLAASYSDSPAGSNHSLSSDSASSESPPDSDLSTNSGQTSDPNGRGPVDSKGAHYPKSAPFGYYSTMAAAKVVNSILALQSLTPSLDQATTNGGSLYPTR